VVYILRGECCHRFTELYWKMKYNLKYHVKWTRTRLDKLSWSWNPGWYRWRTVGCDNSPCKRPQTTLELQQRVMVFLLSELLWRCLEFRMLVPESSVTCIKNGIILFRNPVSARTPPKKKGKTLSLLSGNQPPGGQNDDESCKKF